MSTKRRRQSIRRKKEQEWSTTSTDTSPGGSRPTSPRGNLAMLASRRASSPKNLGERFNARRSSNFLELPNCDQMRPRVSSLPEYTPRDEIYRLRTFSITNKGVVNKGDVFPRRSKSNNSMASNSSRHSPSPHHSGERSPFDNSCCGSSAVSTDSVQSNENSRQIKFRVVLLGQSGVGKSALVSQFMTSDYINTYDVSLDDEFGERTVSVHLEDKESELIFIDHPSSEMSVENCLSTYDPHACVVVYSVIEKNSFNAAGEILRYLWEESVTRNKAVILVGNKCDLARSRVISPEEGRNLATSTDAKFIETSSGIQHNVDELLVGVLKQCRLRETKIKKRNSKLNLAKEIFGKFCDKSKSCDNLHVL